MSNWVKINQSFEMFQMHDLCRPGVLIAIRRGPGDPSGQGNEETMLIGDLSQAGGGCGCCGEINKGDTVLRALDISADIEALKGTL